MTKGTEIYLEQSSPAELRTTQKDEFIRHFAKTRPQGITFTQLYNQLGSTLKDKGIALSHITDANQLLQALKHANTFTPEDEMEYESIKGGSIPESAKTGTEMYLEAFGPKPKEKFEPIQKNKAGPGNKQPFIPKSGPESEGNGFKDKAKPEEPANLSQGTEKYNPKADEVPGPGPKTDHEDNSADNVNGFTDFNVKKALNPEKTPLTKLNNSRHKNLMEKNNNTKSEFDRLCEEVLGPEEVELGIDEPQTNEAPSGAEGTEEECAECEMPERIRGIITELEGILAELEGTEGGIDGEPNASEEGEDVPLVDGGVTPGGAVKESAEQGGTGKIEKAPDGVAALGVKSHSKKFKVEGEANPSGSGEGDGMIEQEHSGKIGKASDGVKAFDPKSKKFDVKGKVTGKNQVLFKV